MSSGSLHLLDKLSELVSEEFHTYLNWLRKLVAQPSISALDLGLEECAGLISDLMNQLGMRSRLLESGSRAPAVYGEIGKGSPELLIYGHYDVQPPDPESQWRYPAFCAQIHENRIWGRGSADSKCHVVAGIAGAELVEEICGGFPGKLKMLWEGQEEIASPDLPKLISEHRSLLGGDGCLILDGGLNRDGSPIIQLGAKGILYLEIRSELLSRDVHSSRAPIVPNPAWRLIQALNSIRDPDGKILIPGFYERIRHPQPWELELIEKIDMDPCEISAELGIQLDLSPRDLARKLILEPSCNICGIHSGYTQPGSKTIIPKQAFAKLDFRLVPDQDPHLILESLREHLRSLGYGDLKIIQLGGYPPAKSPLDSKIAKAAIQWGKLVYDADPVIYPLDPGSIPMYLFSDVLGMHTIITGIAPHSSNIHSLDENLELGAFERGLKYVAGIIYGFMQAHHPG